MTGATLNAVFELLSWSFNALVTGNEPDLNFYGKPVLHGGEQLANGWQAILFQVRGDWAFYKEAFAFPAWNAKGRICWLCEASSSLALAWTTCSADAAWRSTCWSHEGFLQDLHAHGLVPPALMLTRGLRIENFTVDVLHAVDQGIASHIIGNILWLLIITRCAPFS